MQIRIRDDEVKITGYVNAIERKSNPIRSRMGKFIERICKGAFKRAIERNDNIRVLENHDWSRDLGGTKEGNLKLNEDNIGLRAELTTKDPETIKKARNGEYVGWSFGFRDRDGGVDMHEEDGMTVRDVKDLDLYEVSLLDRSRTPAYDGTLVSVRSDDEIQFHGEALLTEVDFLEVRAEEPEQPEVVAIDYSKAEQIIKEMKEEM